MTKKMVVNLKKDGFHSIKCRTWEIDKAHYWSITQFCELTEKSNQCIRRLCNYGNVSRQMKSRIFGKELFIRAEELTEYPFLTRGRVSKEGDSTCQKFSISQDGEITSYMEVCKIWQ